MEDPQRPTLDYRQGPDPLDPGGAGLRDPSSGEGIAAFCLAAVCPTIVVVTVKWFAPGLLCAGLPLSLIIACFTVPMAWRALYEGRLNTGFGWASLVVLVVTYVWLFGWMCTRH